MIVNSVALRAYQNALKAQQGALSGTGNVFKKHAVKGESFVDTLKDSLSKVNDLQNQRAGMVEDFAAGKNQNVHELMIELEKAGLTMSMTAAVRSKVLAAYQELTKMQF